MKDREGERRPADDGDAIFVGQRPRLIGLAYRLLGSLSDAEDVVADVYLRWRDVDLDGVNNPAAYLTTMVSRAALDRCRARSRQRESYVGPWLPEPVLTSPVADPADAVIVAETLTLGFLALLDRLEPLERAAYLLHEVFGEPYAAVAATLQRNETACRKLVSRARQHVHRERRARRQVDPARRDELLAAFGAAVVTGDLEGLQRLLTDDVMLISDGGAEARAARRPVLGPHRVSRFLVGVQRRLPTGTTFTALVVNYEPAVAIVRHGTIQAVLVFDVLAEGIRRIHMVVNPDKLAPLRRQHAGEMTGGAT